MKLLFDQYLSHRLVHRGRDVGLKTATDSVIWEYAKQNAYMIVSKHSDFHQRSFVVGYPPKVVWIRRGNCSTGVIERILREQGPAVAAFEADVAATFLILS